jgi:FkbM family methyltransferase
MNMRFRPFHWTAVATRLAVHWPGRMLRRRRVASAARRQRSFIGRIKGPGCPMSIHPETFLAQAYVEGSYEQSVVRYLKRTLRPGMRCIDAGANVGFFTLLMSRRVGAAGNVIAFEPTSKTHAILRENIDLNARTNVVAECLALSDHEGEISFHEGPPGFDVYNSAGDVSHPMAAGREFRTVVVPCTTIDGYLRRMGIGAVDVVKFDVEGSELFALKGMEGTMKANPRMKILVELADQTTKGHGYRAREIYDWFLRQQWQIELIDDRGDLVPAPTRDAWNSEMVVAFRR